MKAPAGSPPETARRDDKDSASASQSIANQSIPGYGHGAETKSDESGLHQAMLAAILDALPVGVIIADAKGEIILDNAASRDLWGRQPDATKWEGYSDWIGYWPDSGERLRAEDWPLARTLRNGEAVRNQLIRNERSATGEQRFFLSNSAPILDREGRIIAATVAELDVTDRLKAQQALRDSEERFASFMRHLPGLAWIKGSDGRYAFANEAAEKVFGMPRAKLYGKTDEELFPPETAAQFRENDIKALASDAGLVTVETFRHEDGVLHHSLVSKFPIRDAAARFSGVGGVAIDVTERVTAEQRLKEVTERLREDDRRKDEFLAMLAHELRNPLAPIQTGLELLRKHRGDSDVGGRVLEMMERQVKHLVRLVEDLLDISRIRHGKIELKKERIDLAVVITHAIEATRHLMETAGLELRVALPERPLLLEADPVRLAQAFTNLLNNAVKYTEPGGRVEVAATRVDDQAVVSVTDTGLGISHAMLPSVFDLFAQAKHTLDRAEGGLGIGLSLVRSLVELHGGVVEVASEGERQGSRFVVRLPLTQSVEADAPPPKMAPRATVSSRRVLIVDDTPDVADSLALFLETLGAQVRVAYGGAQALVACDEFKPELILLDIGMSEMDGFETARRIRAQPAGRQAVLVALTGWGDEQTRRRVKEASFDQHLTKPANLAELERLLENIHPEDLSKGGDRPDLG